MSQNDNFAFFRIDESVQTAKSYYIKTLVLYKRKTILCYCHKMQVQKETSSATAQFMHDNKIIQNVIFFYILLSLLRFTGMQNSCHTSILL